MASHESTEHTKMLLQQLKEVKMNAIVDAFEKMYPIWRMVGVDSEQTLHRASNAWDYVFESLQDIVNEEMGFYEDLVERIKNYDQKILELSLELNITKIEVDGPLIEKEEIMRKELDKLSKLKHKRLKEFQELHSVELKYCKLLDMPPLGLSSITGVPSEKDLAELGQQINMMKAEKECRLKKFQLLKKELTTIFEVTEFPPESAFENDILNSKEVPSLSSETFQLLEQIVIKKKNKKSELENEKKELTEKLLVLWDRLNINKTEREIFLSRHNDYRISSLSAIKQEISRCEEIKRQNIKMYIDGLKEELEDLWEKCFVCCKDRKFPQTNTDVVENDLELYDKEVANWKQYYKNVEHIIEKIQERQKLWELMTVMEKTAADPNRFKNRRGNLLKEERQRKKLQKDLPALELEIYKDIKVYEEAHDIPFRYYGDDFTAFVDNQWEERAAQKENEKKERQMSRTKQIENDVTSGAMSIKRACPTPKSAPSKLLKSTPGVRIYRTPGCTPSKPVPSTVGKSRSQVRPLLESNVRKDVLKENNNPSSSMGPRKCLDETTYSGFASKLNSSSRKTHRSSVLASRKVVGTRMTNSSKRKSANKSMKKASSKTSNSKILTPARGKLGIPFLI